MLQRRHIRDISLRRVLAVVVTAGLVLTIGGAGAAAFFAWSRPGPDADRLVLVGDAIAAASLLLTAAAVAVTLVAYLVTTVAPDLEPEIAFRCSDANRPVFLVDEATSAAGRRLTPFRQLQALVRIHNHGSGAARNPAVRIDLMGLGGLRPQAEWRPVEWTNRIGIHAVQWDGGAHFAVHGDGIRVLPLLTFEDVFALPDPVDPALRV